MVCANEDRAAAALPTFTIASLALRITKSQENSLMVFLSYGLMVSDLDTAG